MVSYIATYGDVVVAVAGSRKEAIDQALEFAVHARLIGTGPDELNRAEFLRRLSIVKVPDVGTGRKDDDAPDFEREFPRRRKRR